MADLLTAYPDLGAAISRLSGGRTWRFTGASALLLDATHLYLEITKPRHWRRRADGLSEVWTKTLRYQFIEIREAAA